MNRATFTISSEPAVEPITLAQLKERLRVTSNNFDNELTQLLTSVRRQVEADARRRLITQTVVMYLDEFPTVDEFEIRDAPISSVTSVDYIDVDGNSQTFSSASYNADITSTPPRIRLVDGQSWPDTETGTPNAVIVTYVAGYGATAATVPAEAVLAIVEGCRASWGGCEHSQKRYEALVSRIGWTAYHRV